MTPAALSALSLGYLFPVKGRHILRVHSAFQHALNLRSEEGRLLTLLCAEKYQNLADAARIMQPEWWDWRREISGTGTIRLADGVFKMLSQCTGLSYCRLIPQHYWLAKQNRK
ncbi:hypothetical protein D9P64_08940 [Salmonella enterica subsp. enterica serovar Kibi]|uniref:Uncharacterized protein n=1 Tax=Salmonella enterica subsp. enterica serovar Cardoner TaxID=2564309 RepID=A0A5W3RL36_SALET|nr:hypothetical protein [Salmonella enterica]EBP8881245.1 hypothetical protein [Salmonella enterica subsp. enterica]EBU8205963.1 hypothetical protein [Salmonella enterica subsp. enterica serovar Cardoner]EBZ2860450.1 hypothetical protein [Salmonella enterica subsp. enterica serovar Kibi]EDS3573833.1 hypothetical protein [Salmonella enterica subsp. enterica serovar Sangera]EEE8154627.1 hypothetical protein [Salmonella enterica subsp. enterica serovar Badagry]EEI6325111.1 hypothetical protein [